MTIISICSKMSVKDESSANSSSTSDFKSHVILLFKLVKSGHLLGRASVVDLGNPNPTVIVHVGRVNSMTFTHSM